MVCSGGNFASAKAQNGTSGHLDEIAGRLEVNFDVREETFTPADTEDKGGARRRNFRFEI
jgi:hypothetical protein